MKKILLLSLLLCMGMFGCGSVSGDGSTSLFQTGSVSFTTTTINSSSTVSAKPNSDDTATVANLTITVLAYPNFTLSPFTVRDMRYIYTQTSGGTASFSVNGSTNFTANLLFAPVLASGDVMDRLVDLGFVPGVTSQTESWIFNVQATYTVVEDNSGKTRSYSVPLGKVRFI